MKLLIDDKSDAVLAETLQALDNFLANAGHHPETVETIVAEHGEGVRAEIGDAAAGEIFGLMLDAADAMRRGIESVKLMRQQVLAEIAKRKAERKS